MTWLLKYLKIGTDKLSNGIAKAGEVSGNNPKSANSSLAVAGGLIALFMSPSTQASLGEVLMNVGLWLTKTN